MEKMKEVLLKIKNSLTSTNISFAKDSLNFKIYCCGPTVYDHIHLGNARILLSMDLLIRFLKQQKVLYTYIQNITDIDDKIIARAQNPTEELTNLFFNEKISEKEVSNYYYKKFKEITNLLNIIPPTKEPLATHYIPQMIEYIKKLIELNHAYINETGVYFKIDPLNYNFFRPFQACETNQNNNLENMKKEIQDFALWKIKEEGLNWNSPWGKGRPGWHTECVAMSCELLMNCNNCIRIKENNFCSCESIDVHAGGIDLQYPHHQNELVQYLAYGKKEPVLVWWHINLLTVNGKKMSKSLNNFFYLKNLIKNSFEADSFRYLIYSYNYDSIIDFDLSKFEQAKRNMIFLRKFYFKYIYNQISYYHSNEKTNEEDLTDCLSLLSENLNSSAVIQLLYSYVQDKNHIKFFKVIKFLGFNMQKRTELSKEEIDKLIEKRTNYRINQQLKEADNIRDFLFENHVEIEDQHEKSSWYYF